ncbi:recombinase family protein [Mesorhizobium tamadayense]|uniref:recombinase family protein n=1 Tax=Mesorhizobium tamadayense TaxID=425306 RepID=UPI00315D3FDA
MATLLGHARVSKTDGSHVRDLQCDALAQAGFDTENIYEDAASGRKDNRPRLAGLPERAPG